MKKYLLGLLFLTLPAFAVTTFDDVVVENSCTVPAPVNPTDATTKSYVDTAIAGATIPDATTLVKGKVKLAGDLAGTADLPTVPGLSGKEPTITAGTTLQYWRGDKSFQTLSTSVVPEGSNLYFTNGRVDTEFDTRLATKSTSDLSEGSNLYYTNARVDSEFDIRLATKSTTNLAEGSNLYYTDARVSSFVSPIYAPLASPALTGVPTAPTAALGTSTTQVATTAFVLGQGFLSATGAMPAVSSTSLVTTTSASTTFVNAITASITVTASSAPVLAKCVLDVTSATAASVATVRVTVNGVSGGSVTESLTTATTQHLTVPNQNLSAALGPGTYTVNCDFNRASGTGTVTVAQGHLAAIALQGTASNGITQLSGLGLSAGPGSGAQSLTGTLSLAGGGTNANNAAVNGGIAYGTASAINLSAAGALGQLMRSGGAAAPTWTNETFPASTTVNQILYSSAANVVSGLATANTGFLATSSAGVPSITACATANRLVRTNGTTMSCAQAALTTDVTGTLPVANGGTGLSAAFAAGRMMYSNGTTFAADALLTYDATNNRLTVGNGGTSRLSAVVQPTDVQPNDFALNVFSRAATRPAISLQNENTLPSIDMTNSGGTAVGANIFAEASRGTLTARTQSLSGDTLFSILSHGHTGAAYSTGFSSAIAMVASENVANATNGGEITLSTTPNGGAAVVERARVTNDGQLKAHYGVSVDTSTAQPTCDVAHRGLWWVIQGGAGVADVLQICLKDAADVYGWVTK